MGEPAVLGTGLGRPRSIAAVQQAPAKHGDEPRRTRPRWCPVTLWTAVVVVVAAAATLLVTQPIAGDALALEETAMLKAEKAEMRSRASAGAAYVPEADVLRAEKAEMRSRG